MASLAGLKRAAACVGACAVGLALVPRAVTGCYDRVCDGDVQFHEKGSLIDPDTWQSTPLSAEWLAYPHERSWVFDLSALGSRQVDWVLVYISPASDPNKRPAPGQFEDNYTLASGNTGEIQQVRMGDCWVPNWTSCVTIHNATCAEFYVRVVVHASGPRADSGAPPDAAPADAAATDAPAEGG